MIKKIELEIESGQTASFYKTDITNKGTIFYLHGGGLLYGDKDDLPKEYINQFLDAGYNFFSLNYLLAPESNYADIIESIYTGYNWLSDNLANLSDNSNIIVFGRSAGAYLCYQIIMSQKITHKPIAFLDFYGFYDILDSKLTSPDKFYAKYPQVDIASLTEDHPIYSGNVTKRFPIYLFARKDGSWIDMLNLEDQQIEHIDFDQMPPTYILHATSDPDVPFSIALSEKSKNKQAILKSVNSDQHDFDRTVTSTNIQFYQATINWLNKI